MEALGTVKAKVGAKSAGGCEAAGTGEPQPAPSTSPAGSGSPAPPEPHASKLEDLETLATVGSMHSCHYPEQLGSTLSVETAPHPDFSPPMGDDVRRIDKIIVKTFSKIVRAHMEMMSNTRNVKQMWIHFFQVFD